MIVRVRDLIAKLKEFDEDLFIMVHTKRNKKRDIFGVWKIQEGPFIHIKIQLKGKDNT